MVYSLQLHRWNVGRGTIEKSTYKQQPGNEELRPILRQAGANNRKQAKYSGKEDGTTTTIVIVERIREPAATRIRYKL